MRAPAPGVPSGAAAAPSPPRVEGDRTLWSLIHRAPIRMSFEARVPEGGAARVHFLAGPDTGEASGYAVAIIGDHEVEVRRSCDRPLRRVRIPDDGARHGTHRWELRVDPRPDEGGAVEIELRRDGTLIALAVDPEPFLEGARVITRARGGASIESLGIEGEPR